MICSAQDPAEAAKQRKRQADYVFKLFRTQRYLHSCEEDMRHREAKLEQMAT